ncbi:MAG: YoaK family protein [Terriglobales bacterium]
MKKGPSLSRWRSGEPDWLRGRNAMVLVLTWAAASVDAISYLGLGHVFTANMTGNAVLLGLSIGQGQGLAALRSIIALAGFAVGVALSAVMLEARPGRGEWPVGVTGAVAAEAVILGVFTVTWHLGAHRGGLLYGLIALSAVAMGIQSAAIRHLKVPGIATTYITGTLTSMVAEFVSWLTRLQRSPLAVDPTGQSVALEAPTARHYHGARLQAVVLLVYVLAAVVSALLQAGHSRLVSVSPLLAVALVVVNAHVRRRREPIP